MFSKKPYDARLRSLKRNKLLTAVMSALVGLVLLLRPETSLQLLCKFIGMMILVTGVIMLLMYVRQKETSLKVHLVSSILLTVLGLWIFLRPGAILAVIPTVIGFIVIFDGVFNLGESIAIHRQNRHSPLLPVILGVITVLLGLMLIFKPLGVAAVITQMIGIVTLYNGISDLVIALRIHPNVGE